MQHGQDQILEDMVTVKTLLGGHLLISLLVMGIMQSYFLKNLISQLQQEMESHMRMRISKLVDLTITNYKF